ncbi:unnamed protein product [Protopolystoma xenopodis]|uniref:Uncharacterized protein n=1 Tax=Protopolystoma xenopodis TaxID=117903 RepID=A0A3S5AN40_9PLAT|nr:unnamed protein product [Protopolystoma xenopodis]
MRLSGDLRPEAQWRCQRVNSRTALAGKINIYVKTGAQVNEAAAEIPMQAGDDCDHANQTNEEGCVKVTVFLKPIHMIMGKVNYSYLIILHGRE